ncbi:hypothetical protein [Paraburkholderia heleia]|uniref:hypothetical protein n=1 Tax=Paraburkholderia heleia TaxID=634127 RepID=UPI002AB61D16|nr:hypothetical protein [Paraburkholderia heleia]
MSSRQEKTFALQSPADFFAKLQWEFARLKGTDPQTHPDFIYQSITCANDAWHMADWVYHSLPELKRREFPREKHYRQFVQNDSPALAICREIADASKHSRIDANPNPSIETRFVRTREPSTGSESIWWFVVTSGHLRDIRQVIDSAVMYWCRTLDTYGLSRETPFEDIYAYHRSVL